MTTLFIVNHAPYGTEHAYNAMRLATVIAGDEDKEVLIFLQGDAVFCSNLGQDVPDGYYNVERMLKISSAKGARIGVCGTCMGVRGLSDDELAEGSRRSTLKELAEWTRAADKVLVF